MVKLIQDFFLTSAQKFPQKVAVSHYDQQITYQDLDQKSNQLAHQLRSLGLQRNDRVAFNLHKSIKSILSILAILKADAGYVPLDSRSPVPRLKQIVEDCKPRIIICDLQTLNETRQLVEEAKTSAYQPQIMVLDQLPPGESSHYYGQEHLSIQPTTSLHSRNGSHDLAYIFYTSGSTGKPKGVMITHANVIHFTKWAVKRFGITAEDRLSNHAPMHFDLSTFDIYCTFKAGATVCIVPYELNLFPEKVVRYIEENNLTIWLSVPSILVYMLRVNALNPERIPSLRMIFSTGEVLPTPYLVELMKMFPHKKFINMFGPTETTVECTYYVIDQMPTDVSKNIPIGKGCDHLEVFALNDKGQSIHRGEVGELYVRGPSVSPGYWNNPEKTNEAFVQNPLFPLLNDKVYKTGDLVELGEEGNYIFRGRKDNQIKFMGYRIELGEIQAAIYSLSYVQEATVIFIDDKEKSEIISFLTTRQNCTDVNTEMVQKDLAGLIPKYMIPKTLRLVSSLPRTSTGKIDNVTLKQNYLEEKKIK